MCAPKVVKKLADFWLKYSKNERCTFLLGHSEYSIFLA